MIGHLWSFGSVLRFLNQLIVGCGGNHGDVHWHRAVKHDAGWYPQGLSLGYTKLCTSFNNDSNIAQSQTNNSRQAEIDKAEHAQREAERLEAG